MAHRTRARPRSRAFPFGRPGSGQRRGARARGATARSRRHRLTGCRGRTRRGPGTRGGFSSRLADLLRRERTAAAEFLVALADFDSKRIWVELGYNSLFHFLTRELGMSKGAAHYRKTAADLIQRFPEVLEPLTDGRVCITTVVEIARVITPENRAEVLPRFFHLSRDEAKQVAAEIRPVENPPRREVVTALPAAATPTVAPPLHALPLPVAAGSAAEPPHANSDVPVGVPAPAPPPAVEVVPLTAELSRLHITVSRRLLAKLDQARDALSNTEVSRRRARRRAGDLVQAR